jgi:hypothetical protein
MQVVEVEEEIIDLQQQVPEDQVEAEQEVLQVEEEQLVQLIQVEEEVDPIYLLEAPADRESL